MKVLLINGSPNEKGCTYTALCEVEKALQAEGIETEIFHIGEGVIRGCIGCGGCKMIGRCVFNEDTVNRGLDKAETADGYIFGSPVHFAGASGALTCFMDRFFYAGKNNAYKPAAAIASARRGGTTATFDQLNKYFTIRNMPVVSSQYWNMVHGSKPEDVQKDLEGMQIMRTLGRNMAWMLKCIEAGKNAGIEVPQGEAPVRTNFIR
ncbi:NADPH-dependent FMN reductase [Sporanaerobium hydrogeniformans]|uniref:NADPH-dependent FMN reductase n=1 Tax=Sporanaerobium hydrogeniformans TaxID=3072179 RepID=A0AC61DBA3_9FIRM|nr:flavodoxin family protein [Sporanaerobium hydrogeniformans]PHV70048.1 NADPH-dependent FMN reductase [Sporanaerobium hydrogeniformans]